MFDKDNVYLIIMHAILAFLGGCTRELSIVQKKGFRVFSFVSGAIVSTFCGVVTYFLCMNYGMEPWLTAALTSLAGYIGIPILDFFIVIIKKKAEAFSKHDKGSSGK